MIKRKNSLKNFLSILWWEKKYHYIYLKVNNFLSTPNISSFMKRICKKMLTKDLLGKFFYNHYRKRKKIILEAKITLYID